MNWHRGVTLGMRAWAVLVAVASPVMLLWVAWSRDWPLVVLWCLLGPLNALLAWNFTRQLRTYSFLQKRVS